MKLRLLPALFVLVWLLPGCIVYKIDIQQGNEITEEMLAGLEIGMSPEEVVKVFGYPLINDPFHVDRWDYYFYLKEGKTGKVEQHSVTLRFTDDALSDIESRLLEPDADD